MHYRQRIRDAAAAVLLNRTAADGNVFTSRARPVLNIVGKGGRVLSVYTADEQSDRSGDGWALVRDLTLTVEGMAGGGDDLDDVLDDLAAEVEALFDADPTLGAVLSEQLVLQSTEMEISARGESQIGAFRMDFACQYRTDLPVPQPPEIPLPDIDGVTIRQTPTPIGYAAPLGPPQSDEAPPLPAYDPDAWLPPEQRPGAVELMDDDLASRPVEPVAPVDCGCP